MEDISNSNETRPTSDKEITSQSPLDLFAAAKNGDLNTLKYWLEEIGVDINIRQNLTAKTLLHVATESGQLNIIKYLIDERKANVEAKTTDDLTPLYLAVLKGRFDILKYLVDKGANLKTKVQREGINPLHVAAASGNLAMIKYMVEEKGIDADIKSNTGNTPLMYAANAGQFDVVKYLVGERKVDVNTKNIANGTVLHVAALEGRLDIVKYLIVKGKANINVKDMPEDELPLHKAARRDNVDVVKYLVEDKVTDVNCKNGGGNTPLHLAAYFGQVNTVKYLVDEARADVNVTNNKGDTPLRIARDRKLLSVVQYLEAVSKNTTVRRNRREIRFVNEVSGQFYAPSISSACKPTSFIGNLVYWLTNSVTSVLLPSANTEKHVIQPQLRTTIVDGFLFLLDVGVRKVLGNGYKQAVHDSLLTPEEIVLRRIDPVALNVIDAISDSRIRRSARVTRSLEIYSKPSSYLNGTTRSEENICINSGND